MFDYKELSNEIYSLLKGLGYSPYWYGENKRQLNCIINKCKFCIYDDDDKSSMSYLLIIDINMHLTFTIKKEVENIVNTKNTPFKNIVYDEEKISDSVKSYIYLYNSCNIEEFSYTVLNNIIDIIIKIDDLIDENLK